MKILKQLFGVDVAQDELVVSFGGINENFEKELQSFQIFSNDLAGFRKFVIWLEKQRINDLPVQIVMEATGVYHEKFAYYLAEKQYELSIVLPNKISNYARSLDIKTVTDKTSSQAICLFGLDRNLENWEQPDKNYLKLQQLSREKNQVVEQRVMSMNQLHAEKKQAYPHQKSIERLEIRIGFLKNQEIEIKKDMHQIIKESVPIKEAVKLLCTIPGVGESTVLSVLGETNGFSMIRNKKQLTSYAGFDVKEKISGTSVKGKSRISKRGNKHLRRTMYFPAITAIRNEPKYKALFLRIVERTGIKMKGIIAVARKLLELMYVMFKTKTIYQNDYEQKIKGAKSENENCSILAGS